MLKFSIYFLLSLAVVFGPIIDAVNAPKASRGPAVESLTFKQELKAHILAAHN